MEKSAKKASANHKVSRTFTQSILSAVEFVVSVRFLLAILSFFAYCIQYMQRVSINIGIHCMINNTAILMLTQKNTSNGGLEPASSQMIFNRTRAADASVCPAALNANPKAKIDGIFVWDKEMQSLILVAYYVGQMTAQIPGGWLSLKIGGKRILALSLFVGSIFCILSPFFARWDWKALVFCRFLIGLFHSACWPSLKTIWVYWAPPNERSRLIGISTAGSNIGNIIGLNLGPFLCLYGFGDGWPSIFYIFGAFGVVWFICFMFMASDSPETHSFITEKERDYIVSETHDIASSETIGQLNTPWKAIFKSPVCLVTFFCHFCHNWGNYLFFTQLPSYMKEVLKFDIAANGLWTSIPYVFYTIVIILSGLISDTLLHKNILSRTVIRKIFTGVGFFVPCVAVVLLSFVECAHYQVAVALLAIGIGATGCFYGGGLFVNINDIAGSYSGIVFAVSNTISTIGGIISSYTVGFLTANQTRKEWQIVFFMCAVFYFLGGLSNTIFSNSDVQHWAYLDKKNRAKCNNNGPSANQVDVASDGAAVKTPIKLSLKREDSNEAYLDEDEVEIRPAKPASANQPAAIPMTSLKYTQV